MITKLTPHSVEDWAKEFEKSMKVRTLTEDESEIFIKLHFIREDMDDLKFEKGTVNYVIDVMSKPYPYTIDKKANIVLSMFLTSFGEVRVILAYLQYKLFKEGKKKVDIEFLGLEVFPSGFPTQEFMQEMWNKQKYAGSPDNMLDYGKCYDSIKIR